MAHSRVGRAIHAVEFREFRSCGLQGWSPTASPPAAVLTMTLTTNSTRHMRRTTTRTLPCASVTSRSQGGLEVPRCPHSFRACTRTDGFQKRSKTDSGSKLTAEATHAKHVIIRPVTADALRRKPMISGEDTASSCSSLSHGSVSHRRAAVCSRQAMRAAQCLSLGTTSALYF